MGKWTRWCLAALALAACLAAGTGCSDTSDGQAHIGYQGSRPAQCSSCG